MVPCGLGGHGGLLLPVAGPLGCLAHPHHEVHREDGLWIVAEGAEQPKTLYLGVAHPAHHASHLVGQSVTDVEQQIALSLGEGESLKRGARRGRHLTADAILRKHVGVVAGLGLLVFVGRAVVVVVHVERARGGHEEQGAHFGASHPAERDVGEACEVAVVILVGRRPPACVLVVGVEVGTHHVERAHRHHAVGTHGARVADAEIGRADKGVYFVYGLLRSGGQACQQGEGCK